MNLVVTPGWHRTQRSHAALCSLDMGADHGHTLQPVNPWRPLISCMLREPIRADERMSTQVHRTPMIGMVPPDLSQPQTAFPSYYQPEVRLASNLA